MRRDELVERVLAAADEIVAACALGAAPEAALWAAGCDGERGWSAVLSAANRGDPDAIELVRRCRQAWAQLELRALAAEVAAVEAGDAVVAARVLERLRPRAYSTRLRLAEELDATRAAQDAAEAARAALLDVLGGDEEAADAQVLLALPDARD